jgi:hypothetical protein
LAQLERRPRHECRRKQSNGRDQRARRRWLDRLAGARQQSPTSTTAATAATSATASATTASATSFSAPAAAASSATGDALPSAEGDRPAARPGSRPDPPSALLGRPHPSRSLQAGRARDRAEPATGRRQAPQLPGQARRRAPVAGLGHERTLRGEALCATPRRRDGQLRGGKEGHPVRPVSQRLPRPTAPALP